MLLHPAGTDSGFKECSEGKCRVLLRLLFLCVVFLCELLGVFASGFSSYFLQPLQYSWAESLKDFTIKQPGLRESRKREEEALLETPKGILGHGQALPILYYPLSPSYP